MTILVEAASSSGGVHGPEAWCDAYIALGLQAVVDTPNVLVRTTSELAVVELAPDIAVRVKSELRAIMDSGPILLLTDETAVRWLFFADSADTSRSTAYTALERVGAVLYQHWTPIVLPSAATGARCRWDVKPRRKAQASDRAVCALPRLWTVARAARKAQVAQQ